MKLEYTSEETFKSEIIEFPDEFYNTVRELHETFGNYGPIIVRSDKKSLSFAINKGISREDKEIGTNLYRVTIDMPCVDSSAKYLASKDSTKG